MITGAHWIESAQLRALRWIGAALFALSLHAGIAASLLFWPDQSDADLAGAIAIELAPIAAGAPVEVADIAPGPLTQEATATPETSKQKPVQETMETPPVEASPLAPNPDVPMPQPEKKEKPKESKDRADTPERETPSHASAATVATAPPQLEAIPSALPAAPALGLSAAALRAQASWQKTLVSHLNRYKRYPSAAHAHRIQGEVTVQFTVDRGGVVVTSQVVHSSGSTLLDEEAMTMLRRATPLPVPPAQTQGATFAFVLPIRFQIK